LSVKKKTCGAVTEGLETCEKKKKTKERERERERDFRVKSWSLKRFLRDLGITGPSRGAFTLLGPDFIYQISL
jgi:transposase